MLAVSLALNMVVVGLVAGILLVWQGGGRDHRADLHPPRTPGFALVAMLPRDKRRALRDILEGDRRDRARPIPDPGLAQIADVVRTEPFAPDDLLSALAVQRHAGQARAARFDAALIDVLQQMDGAARAAYADRLDRAARRHGPDRN